MDKHVNHKHTIDLGNGSSIEVIIGERAAIRSQVVGMDKDVVVGPDGIDVVEARYPAPAPGMHGVDPNAWRPAPMLMHHVHQDDGGIRWTDDWPDGKPPKNLPPIPLFGPDFFSEVDYSGADNHRVNNHPYGAHWRRLHVGDPVVFKPKPTDELPKGKYDDELQPARVSPLDVAKAFEAALPGRTLGFGVSANPKADIKLVLVDGWYLALTEANWAKVLSQAPPRNKYLAERYDCDDFAVSFDGWVSKEYEINGCAWVLSISDGHSYNAILVVGDDGNGGKTLHVQLVEPQSDREVPMDPKRHHGLQSGMVII